MSEEADYDARCFCTCCCNFPDRTDEGRLDCTCKQRRNYIDSSVSVEFLLGVLRVVAPRRATDVEKALEEARR